MNAFYLDTSALVKRYVREPGSSFIIPITDNRRSNLCWTSSLACVEVVAALSRRVNNGSLTPAQMWCAEQEFRKDAVRLYHVVDITPNVLAGAMDLAKSHSLRAFDAVHLATAVDNKHRRRTRNLSLLTFLSADQKLNQAALAEGLLLDDPNRYP